MTLQARLSKLEQSRPEPAEQQGLELLGFIDAAEKARRIDIFSAGFQA